MNWKLIVGLGLTGIVPPVASYALSGNPLVSVVLWTLLAAALWVPLVLRARDPQPFLTLLLIGLFAGVPAGIVDLVLLGDPMLIIFGLIAGGIWGALFGAIALGIERLRGRRAATPAP